MKKQDLIIIVALFALMLAWPMVYSRYFKSAPIPARQTTAVGTALTNQAPVALSTEAETTPAAIAASSSNEPAQIASSSAQPALKAVPESHPRAHRQPEQRLILTNADMVLTFSSWGGGLVNAEFPQYRQTVNKGSGPMILDFSNAPTLTYSGFPELSAADDFTLQRNNGTRSASPRNGADGRSVSEDDAVLRVEKTTSTGLHFTRLISFGADYQIIVQDSCRNEGRRCSGGFDGP